MKTKTTYHSNGKLLLTGEYLVLEGAKALAVPTKFGQNLVVQLIDEPKLIWESYDEKGKIWFQTTYPLPLKKVTISDSIATTLLQILQQTQNQNPNFLNGKKGFKVKTNLEFSRKWGLGSSSTLLNNIAEWAKIDAFELLQNTMGGSGYDIACAQHNSPILYSLAPLSRGVGSVLNKVPQLTPINYRPIFSDQLYFVYLNKKQRSHKEIQRFNKIKTGVKEGVQTISEITDILINTTQLKDFEILINEHEKLMSSILKLPTIQDIQFKDYFGQIKSLGAWGGDFILATGNDDTPKYFKKKGFETVLSYNKMVLKQ